MAANKTALRRRARAEEIISRQDPRIFTQGQLTELLEAEGFHITGPMVLRHDLSVIGASKMGVDAATGKNYYVMAGRNLERAADTVVAETEARRRVQSSGVKVVDLSECVPVFLQTLHTAGGFVGQPFMTWSPHGCMATLSGPEGVMFWVVPEEVERVKRMLHQMIVGA
jgi:arginine repressor